LWTYATGGEVNSSPAIDKDGIIYVGSEDYKLYAIKPDGTLKWTYSIGGGIYSSPAIGYDGTIYVGSWDHNLYAIKPDGTEKWHYSTGGGVQSYPVIADDGAIYVGSYDGKLYALNPDGTLKCTYSAFGAIGSSPAIGQDGIIYLGCGNENRLHAVYPDCTLKWKTEMHSNGIGSSPALSPDGTVVYYGSEDGYLYARNTSDGSLKWKSPWTYGGIQSSPAIGIDGTIYVGTQYGNLWAINPVDGSLKWDHYMTLSAWSSPAIGADGTIYFATDYGHIYAMNPDGSEKWIYEGNYDNDGHFHSSPAIGGDGALYIGSTNGKLYAFAPFNAAETFPQRVSVASDGSEGNNSSSSPSISADGRYVAFSSAASNLVPGDTNGVPDVFVHDRTTGQTTRVSVASDGSEGNSSSSSPSISADGRYVAFSSAASNLVPGDTNYVTDIFVHDRTTGQTTRVSVTSGGRQANYESSNPFISADGRYVTFYSDASNLVPEDTNETPDIFVHDRTTEETTRVSVASDGSQANDLGYYPFTVYPSISSDGRYVVFSSEASNLVPGDTNGQGDIFVHDRATGQTTRISVASDGSQANNGSDSPLSISSDGRYVAFGSYASNLVPGDTNNGTDVFVHDRMTGKTTRVSVASDGAEANDQSYYPSISADGRYVTFTSAASNLVSGDTNGAWDIFVAKYSPPSANYRPVITLLGDNPMSIEQGSVFTDPGATATDAEDGDISSKIDVSDTVNTSIVGKTTLTYTVTDSQGLTSTPVVRTVIVTRMKTSPERVSVATDGSQGNNGSSYNCTDLAWRPSISADGRYVAFMYDASNLVSGDTNGRKDIFVHDRTTDQTTRVSVASDGSEGNNHSYYPSISADGRYVAFSSDASNLVPGDTNGQGDIFIHDRTTGQTTRVSVTSDGSEAGGGQTPSVSADGRYVAFSSYASNLVQGDTNGKNDIFVHDRTTGQTTRVSVASDGSQANNNSYYPSISADGRYVAFGSRASNLVPGDTNESFDNFVHDRTTGQTTRVSVASDGSNPSISADGRYVAFGSGAIDAINVHDRMTGQTIRVSDASDGSQANNASCLPSISADGRYVAFGSDASNLVPGDTNGAWDFFVAKYSPPPANYRPVITLLGDNPMSIDQGSAFTDPGATATDAEDGDISSKIHVEVNTSIPGKMTLTYTVTDSQGLASTPVVRTVIIIPLKELSVYLFDSGTGTVTSVPSGINCGISVCSGSYPSGTTVTLTANAADGSTFAGWWGSGCGGTSNCVVKMDANTSINASFALKTYSVSGRVTDSITGLPLSDVTIFMNGPNLTGGKTTTDANGDYTLSGLQHNSNYFLMPYSNYRFSPTSRTISISSNTTGINFQGGALYSVSGQVIDEYGKPIPEAMVLSDDGQSIRTNSSGSFTLYVMAGSRTFTISKAGYTFVPVFLRVSVSANISGLNFTGYDKPPIVMVHGMIGTVDALNNVPDTLMQAGYHVEFAYLYTTYQYTPSLDDNVKYLVEAIERAKTATGQPKVILIAHSMGGLVSRHYIEGDLYDCNDPNKRCDVSALFTFGSPHSGAVIRDYLSFGSAPGGPAIYDCSEDGTRIFNATHDRRAGVDYHLIGGDAPMDVIVQQCIDVCPLWPLPGPCWRLTCYDVKEPIFLHHSEVRNYTGWLFGLFFNGQQNDALVSTDSATGLAGCADRASTDEVHGNWYGDRTYFDRQGDLSRSYYQCLKKVLVDKTATACGQWSDKDRVPTTAAAIGVNLSGFNHLHFPQLTWTVLDYFEC
jgi:outer membrane protein assembly factor BamB/pimeloyl-ACP methyl ester carboxylesterase